MPDQGTPTADPNVDDLMKQVMATMRKELEPFAVEHFALTSEMAMVSIAVSLKRLANNTDVMRMAAALSDNSFKMVNGLNSLCDNVRQAANVRHDDAQLIKSALYTLDSTIAGSQRDLRITVSKE